MLQKVILFFQMIVTLLALAGCTTIPSNGVSTDGSKVYIGPVPIETSQAYQVFLKSPQSETDRIYYLINRVEAATTLKYYHKGVSYNSQTAYKAGIWLMKQSDNKTKDAKSFLRDNVWYAKPSWYEAPSKNPNLIRFPDGSLHVGYYVLLNELALLDETIANDLGSN